MMHSGVKLPSERSGTGFFHEVVRVLWFTKYDRPSGEMCHSHPGMSSLGPSVVNCECFAPGSTSLAHLVSILVKVGSMKP
jgi:hypothetical protein